MRLSIGGAFGMVAALMAIGAGPALGRAPATGQQPADDDPSADDPADAAKVPPKEGLEGGGFDDYQTADEKRKTKIEPEYGIGVRLRTVFVPKPLLELFVDKASSGVLKPGLGLELSRRKGKFELVLGVEYESVSPDDGFWLDKGDDPNVPAETPDFLEFNGLAWLTADVAFLYNAAVSDQVSFRFGAGLGLGVVFGEILQTDSLCDPGTNADNIQSGCRKNPDAAQVNDPADLPPVFPVVDLFIVGLQFRPIEKLSLNLEAGIRTVGFFGLSTNYYF